MILSNVNRFLIKIAESSFESGDYIPDLGRENENKFKRTWYRLGCRFNEFFLREKVETTLEKRWPIYLYGDFFIYLAFK